MTENAPYIPTNAVLIQNDGLRYAVVDSVTPDGVVVVTLGGELTYTPDMANMYAKTMRTLLHENGIDDVPVYGAAYEFGSHHAVLERIRLFRRAWRRIKRLWERDDINDRMESSMARMTENEPTPRYIIELYNKIFAPRINDATTNHAAANILAARMRGLVLYGHSHGGAVIRQMGDYMATDLRGRGYTAPEIRTIQRAVLAVQHAPTAPLEHPRFTTVSFGSAEDTRAQMYNKFYEFLYENSADIVPSFFDTLGANVFVAGRLKNTATGEHDPKGLLDHAVTNKTLTDDGKIIFAAQRNVIVNGVRSAMRGAPMPTIAELANGGIVDFDQLQHNGRVIENWMTSDLQARSRISTRVHQK